MTSTTKRFGYGELTVATIVQATLERIERGGVGELTMRGVAEDLGLSSMAIYYYVRNKGALLDLVVDDVCARVAVPAEGSGTWDERLRRLVGDARRELLRYPGLAGVLQTRPVTPQAMRLGEAADRMLAEGGFTRPARRFALQAVISYLFGALAWESSMPARARARAVPGDRAAEWRYRQTMLPADDLFDYGLDVAIAGLRHKASAE